MIIHSAIAVCHAEEGVEVSRFLLEGHIEIFDTLVEGF